MSSPAEPDDRRPASDAVTAGASKNAVPARQQRLGLAALASAFVMLALLVGGVRGLAHPAAQAAPTPVPTGYQADPAMPDAARTSLYASGQGASGQWVGTTLSITPASRTSAINLYTVKVETSLATDPDKVARIIQATLDDERGWASFGKNSFKLTASDADAQLTFFLASPKTVDALCGAATTKGKWDCRTGNKIVLNSDRWFFKTPTFDSLDDYRAFMINRQVGFWLGQTVTACRKKGAPAPVMADQGADLGGCTPWAWPRTP